jgi:hypothetical protein
MNGTKLWPALFRHQIVNNGIQSPDSIKCNLNKLAEVFRKIIPMSLVNGNLSG